MLLQPTLENGRVEYFNWLTESRDNATVWMRPSQCPPAMVPLSYLYVCTLLWQKLSRRPPKARPAKPFAADSTDPSRHGNKARRDCRFRHRACPIAWIGHMYLCRNSPRVYYWFNIQPSTSTYFLPFNLSSSSSLFCYICYHSFYSFSTI